MSPHSEPTLLGSAVGLGARLLYSLPSGLLTKVFGRPPAEASGLTADAWALTRIVGPLENFAAGQSPTPDELRAETEMLAAAVAAPMPHGMETRDLDLGDGETSLPARLYRPNGATVPGPLLLWFHGGGWAVGSIESHHRSCARLADASGVQLLSVDYRLAPEHPFPAAADDALAAWRVVVSDPGRFGADPGSIAVGGDSAGGNLAAVLCQDLKAAGAEQPVLQLLVYPVTEIGSDRPSNHVYTEGYYLTTERMEFYSDLYAAAQPASNPRVSPINADDLSALAPAFIATALADPLRDEAEDYAGRLAEAGVAVRLDRYPLIHGWFNTTLSRSSQAAHAVLAEGLSAFFADGLHFAADPADGPLRSRLVPAGWGSSGP